jgi:hypothetical protein
MARLDLAPLSALSWIEQLAVQDLTSLVARDGDSVGRMLPWSLSSSDTSSSAERTSLAMRQILLRRAMRR